MASRAKPRLRPRVTAKRAGKPRTTVSDDGDSQSFDRRQLFEVLTDVKKGTFTARMPGGAPGLDGRIAATLNAISELNQRNVINLARVAAVIGAVAEGDLSETLELEPEGKPLEGQYLRTARNVNTMVKQLRYLASEVTRVAREVGSEGKLGGQARVPDASGVWKDLADNVNYMAGNLTAQVRNIADVTTAVARGDLSKKITVDVRGEILELKNTINVMVDQLNGFASEVTRVAREVGTEGRLGGQAHVSGVGGIWKDLTDNVNQLAANLTTQVRNIADVTKAVAKGDLSGKITVDVRGEILELKNSMNGMVDQLNAFASEVTRVAREVGTEGRLGGQASVPGASGTWRDLTDNVNSMARNLTAQVRNIADVTTAVAKGDLSRKITVDVHGEILELKDTINVMVDQLNAFASEVTRVAREVGTEGRLGGQAQVRGVAGVWKELTDNVNLLAANLTTQVRNIAEVTTAVAKGDLSRKISVEVRGEILELKNTINVMVDQLNAFASEVTRVAGEVGTEGKLGGQAQVKGVAGVWKDLTDNVNFMASNLTSQVRNIVEVTTAVANGDLSKKITVDVRGEILELKNTINVMVDQLNGFASEVTRVAREVGTEGRLGGQATVKGVGGVWSDLTDNVNQLAANLTTQVRNIAEVTTAVAQGDLSRKITVEVRGEILELKNTVNVMVDQLNAFASEVTRVAREVGTEGNLGGQAEVKGAAGVWKDLTDNVNLMASNLTSQVRGIARVVSAVAQGDLRRKLVVEAKGEIAALADTINEMTDTLATFAEQVTTVAREVGVEGELGGQASVPGAAGTWKDLTDNVNQLAANLTNQVRAIAEVTTAVTEGDLTRSIGVEAKGEVALLKDKINQMIRNLRETTEKNRDQDWLKTNLARHARLLQGQRDLATVARLILSEVAPLVSAQHGAFYVVEAGDGEEPRLRFHTGYAYQPDGMPTVFALGEGLIGQCAMDKRRMLLKGVPSDYIRVTSGLGAGGPLEVVILPVLFEGQVKAVMELASFQEFSQTHLDFLEQLTDSIGVVIHTIEANTRTEELLTHSEILFAEAREANRSKTTLLSMAGNELRSPLSAVVGYLSMLQDGTLDPEQWTGPIQTLTVKSIELNKIVNDLTMAASIETGELPSNLANADLRELVREAISRAEPRTTLLQAQIAARMPKEPVLVEVDPDHVGRILDALINNALIYTTGSPRVTVTVSDGVQPQVAVEDRGTGVPPELRERIFERFFRVDHRAVNTQPGTGLGLYISQVLAEKNGGSLQLERSELGKGSRFVLRLPAAAPREEEPPARSTGPTVEAKEISSSRTVKSARRPAEAKSP